MSIETKLFQLARQIQPHLRGFYLSGGTATMFQHHHRISTTMDFFSSCWFSRELRIAILRRHFNIENLYYGEDNVDVFINGIKISLVYFPYENVEPLQRWQGLKMASDYDIFLNKLYAVSRRVETKDAFDVAFLYKTYRWDIK